MVEKAKSWLGCTQGQTAIEFSVGSAEDLSTFPDASLNLVTASACILLTV